MQIKYTLVEHPSQMSINGIQKTTDDVEYRCLYRITGHVVERGEGEHHPYVVCK